MYQGDNSVCDKIFCKGLDRVFVPKLFGSQRAIAEFLEVNIPSNIQLTDTPCRSRIYEIICPYYLSPCGNASKQALPSSVCPSDCKTVQKECSLQWDVLD